jgi:sugar phosphate isomerase/epimerase
MTLELGLNLFSAREAMARDADSTLATLAEIGYRNVELAGYYGHKPSAFHDLLTKHGLRAVAAHVPIDRFENELETVIAEAKMFGMHTLVVPWLSEEQRAPQFVRKLPIKLNAWGEEVVKAGMRLAWHNHEFEYEIRVDERTMMNLLLADTHPDYVDFEPDFNQIARAGVDPLTELREMHPRVRLAHAKDVATDGSTVNVGRGIIDWQAIVATSQENMLDYLIIEHNQPDDIRADLGESLSYLDRLLSAG